MQLHQLCLVLFLFTVKVHGGYFSDISAAMKKPMVWVKDSMVSTLQNYHFSEFKNCLTKNTAFNITNLVDIVDEPERFLELHQPWNLRLVKTNALPAGYVLPTTAAEVEIIVRCGLSNSQHLTPNSGGLSFESVSWGKPNQVVLDFRNMREIRINETKDGVRVRVEPGAMVGHIHAHLWTNGGWGLPLSNHLTAGMAGDAVGGGQGPFSSLLGLTVDSITSIDIIDGYGQTHHVTPKNPPDLWWALRGMGPGYISLVTAIELKAFKATDLKLTSVTLRFPVNSFVPSLDAFQKFHAWAEENNPTISRTIHMTTDSYNKQFAAILKGITVQLLHIQDPTRQPQSSDTFLEAVKSIFPKTDDISITNPSYFEYVATNGYTPVEYPPDTEGKPSFSLKQNLVKGIIPAEDDLGVFLNGLNKSLYSKRYFKLKSMFTNRPLSHSELQKLKAGLDLMPPHILIQITTETGAIRDHARTENGYVHRNATFNLSIRYEGTNKPSAVDAGTDWLNSFWRQIQYLDSGETYQNFVDLDYERLERVERFYKQNQGKLVDAKRKWDPENFFETDVSLPTTLH